MYFLRRKIPSLPLILSQVFLVCLASIQAPELTAQEDQGLSHKFTLGSYLSRGDYGASQDTDINFFPLSYELTSFPWILSLSVPYLGLKGPGDVFLETGNIGRGRGTANDFIDESGIGDVVISASYQLPPILKGWVFVDFTLQAKIPTADETRDLGTGETDIGYQLDFYTTLERNTYFSTFGYKQRGKTPLYDLEDSLYSSLGFMRQYGENTYLGLLYDYREKASSNSFESHELMPFVSYNMGTQWNLMFYTIVGFTESSADKTIGMQLSYTLP